MNIALCLSGQARCFKQTHEYVKQNLLYRGDVSVFYHVWDFPKTKELESLYEPKMHMVEKPIKPNLSKYTRVPAPSPGWKVKDPAMSTYCQLYSMKKSIELKTQYEQNNNIKFDWVIRSRFDFALNVRIPFESMDNTKLYIPNCRMTPGRDFGNDQFAFSSSENMNKYSYTFDNIDRFYDAGTTMIGEEMMSANWKLNNLIGDNLVYVDINHPFPPGQHNGTWHSLYREDFDEWQKP